MKRDEGEMGCGQKTKRKVLRFKARFIVRRRRIESVLRMNPVLSSAVLAALFAVVPLSAETLVEYTFGTSSNTSNATTSGTNVTTQSFARGAGTGTSTQYSSTTGFPAARSIYVTSDFVDEPISASSTDWLGFTISATSGNTLKLSEFSFYYAYTHIVAPAITGTATFEVRSSLDGFATTIASFTQEVVNNTTPTWQLASVSLSAMTYQNLDTISFRIFLADGENGSGSSQLRIDTVRLTGFSDSTVVVPEPSTAAVLVGLAVLGCAGVRRRVRRG